MPRGSEHAGPASRGGECKELYSGWINLLPPESTDQS